MVVVVETTVGWGGKDISLCGRKAQFDSGDGRGVNLRGRR